MMSKYIAVVGLLALSGCVVSPAGIQLQTSQAAYRACLVTGATCETERRMFEADRDLYDPYSRRMATAPQSVSCTYGGGIMNCN
jgi:hypothetical protein